MLIIFVPLKYFEDIIIMPFIGVGVVVKLLMANKITRPIFITVIITAFLYSVTSLAITGWDIHKKKPLVADWGYYLSKQ